MKQLPRITFLFVVSYCTSAVCIAYPAYYQMPRVSVWTLAGSEAQAKIDGLIPVVSTLDRLFYTDGQAGYGYDDAWYAGIGLGYRQIVQNVIYGGYLFFDYNESQNQNSFPVISPGIEAMYSIWDFRLNGYFPVGDRTKKGKSYFPSGDEMCGQQGNNSFVVFQGHQQFEHRFFTFEQVGPGADAEVGYTFERFNNAQLHAGVYHYNLDYTDDINGIESRFEIPINPKVGIAIEANYDNQEHGAIVAGLRFNFGAIPEETKHLTDLHRKMLDPIPRNLGSVHTGSGIPIIEGTKDEGLFLRRDNIYFFSATGGSTFVDPMTSGTIENPLSNDQFTQTVVNAIGSNTNFYFNSGTYLINNDSSNNGRVSLLTGQAIFGRTPNYSGNALGSDRPTLLGGLDLFSANHQLNSLQLENQSIGTANQLTALDVESASNVTICNSLIEATSRVTIPDNTGENFATGIYANNSGITIQNSTISARALIDADNSGFNFAAAIGGNATSTTFHVVRNFSGNTLNILSSNITALAAVSGNNTLNFLRTQNSAAGIGGNNSLGTTDTLNNIFNIINSTVSGVAAVTGSNDNFNYASGIGGNSFGGFANFTANNFNIQNSNLRGFASIGFDSTNYINSSTGIGGNVKSQDDILPVPGPTIATVDFTNNTFTIKGSRITSLGLVIGDNSALNLNAGIGGNANCTATFNSAVVSANFNNNIINIAESTISGVSESNINDFNNKATGIGGNARTRAFSFTPTAIATASANFINNIINISKSSILGFGNVHGDNNFLNRAVGLGGISGTNANSVTTPITRSDANFIGNIINISESQITGMVTQSIETSESFAVGLGGNASVTANSIASSNFNNNHVHITLTDITSRAIVNNDNIGTNLTIGIGGQADPGGFATLDNNFPFEVTNSSISALSLINGINGVGAFNSSLAVRLNSGNLMSILQNKIDLSAIIIGPNSGANSILDSGFFAGPGTTLHITNSIVNMLARVSGGPGSNAIPPTSGAGTITTTGSVFNTTIIP